MTTPYSGPTPQSLRALAEAVDALDMMRSWAAMHTPTSPDAVTAPPWHKLNLSLGWGWSCTFAGYKDLSVGMRAIVGERFNEIRDEAIRRQQAKVDALRAAIAREFGLPERPVSLYPMPSERIVVFGDREQAQDARAAGPLTLVANDDGSSDCHRGADGACSGACDSCTTCRPGAPS